MTDYEIQRKSFTTALEKALNGEIHAKDLQKLFDESDGNSVDKKMAVDQALKDKLFDLTLDDAGSEQLISLLNLTTEVTKMDICTAGTLFSMLTDMFDMLMLDACGSLFDYIEQNVALWKTRRNQGRLQGRLLLACSRGNTIEEIFYNAGKNYLLRMCNDLLRRLSKSQDTVFCGRIQLFLARLFPLEEKSGLNLTSQFNIENVTTYSSSSEGNGGTNGGGEEGSGEGEVKKMEVEGEGGEVSDSAPSVPVDYNLYRKFWLLQDYFRKPTQCYNKSAWTDFTTYTDEVLACFSSYKLDDFNTTQSPAGATSNKQSAATAQTKTSANYFAKYLTSEKLLDLQLSDSSFRRSFLVQLLVTFQYLTSQVKFKTSSHTLTDEQTQWVKDTQDKIKVILRETPPNGNKFTDTIEHMLAREENWSGWKNDGCTSFIRNPPTTKPASTRQGRKRSMGDEIRYAALAAARRTEGEQQQQVVPQVKMGNPELTRLWNLCPDNMAACRAPNRRFLPTMDEYFEEAIEQSDPSGGIEEQYKLVNNGQFAWKSLRLLARKSPLFFAQSGSQATTPPSAKPLNKYLESVLHKLAKSMASSTSPEKSISVDQGNSVDEDVSAATSPELPSQQNPTDGNTLEEVGSTVLDDEEESKESLIEEQSIDDDDNNIEEEVGGAEAAVSQHGIGVSSGSLASDSLLNRLAGLMKEEDLMKFARVVNFTAGDVEGWKASSETTKDAALKMLKDWKLINEEDATVTELKSTLEDCQLSSIINQLF